jgi:hypothetical protein
MTKLSTRQKLEKFHETVQELKSTSLMKKGLSSNMEIIVKGLEMHFETQWPEENDLRSFLLTFRHFVADKEDVFMNHILNLCHQKLTDDKLREYLAGARHKWKKGHDTVGLDIVYQGKRQTPEQITQLWLSGTYFHKDEDKRSILKGLPYHQMMLFKHQFLSFLVGGTRIILYVDRIVEKSLNEGLLMD